jgi:hypothetical protein
MYAHAIATREKKIRKIVSSLGDTPETTTVELCSAKTNWISINPREVFTGELLGNEFTLGYDMWADLFRALGYWISEAYDTRDNECGHRHSIISLEK